MTNQKNKVKYGLKNFKYAERTETDTGVTYGTVKSNPGSVSISLNSQASSDPFYADDGVYSETETNSGYGGELEFAELTDEFRKTILAEEEKNGVLVENANAKTKEFAAMFEFDGDQFKRRVVFWRVKVTKRPDISHSTKSDKPTPETVKVSVRVMPLETGEIKGVANYDESKTSNYAKWYDSVITPEDLNATPSN